MSFLEFVWTFSADTGWPMKSPAIKTRTHNLYSPTIKFLVDEPSVLMTKISKKLKMRMRSEERMNEWSLSEVLCRSD